MKTPAYIRTRNVIDEYGPQGLHLRSHVYPSISAAKKHSRELQAGQMGSGILRTQESLDRQEDVRLMNLMRLED